MNPSWMRASRGWGYPERVETNDKASDERSLEVYEVEG